MRPSLLALLLLSGACTRTPTDPCVKGGCPEDTAAGDSAATLDSGSDSGNAEDSGLDSGGDSGAPPVPPTVAILRPVADEVLDGSAVEVEIALTDFVLSTDFDAAPTSGVGHLHLSVDRVFFDETTAGTGWITRLTEGRHVLGVELVTSDHRPLAPAVAAAVTVQVPTGSAFVRIVPPDGYADPWTSATLPLGVEVGNFTLDDAAIGEDAEPGHGHYHVYVDDTYIGFAASGGYTLYNLPNGTHTVAVVLSGNDHAESTVRDRWTFEVSDGRPDIRIDADGIVVDGDSARVPVSVENFTLVPITEEEVAVEGEGHYHVYVDGEYVTASADTSLLLEGLSEGSHMVMVELVDAEHNPIVPEVYDEVPFEVPSGR
jgi:hypothetical protein